MTSTNKERVKEISVLILEGDINKLINIIMSVRTVVTIAFIVYKNILRGPITHPNY